MISRQRLVVREIWGYFWTQRTKFTPGSLSNGKYIIIKCIWRFLVVCTKLKNYSHIGLQPNHFLPDGPQHNRHSKLQCHVQILQMYNRDERYPFITIQSINSQCTELNVYSVKFLNSIGWWYMQPLFSSKSHTMHFNIIVNLLRWYLICCGKMPEYVTKKLWQICMVCSTVNKQRRISGRTTILVVFHFGWLESSHLQWQR